jgi:site-specific DNA-methyltransferase (adenine-specific)
LACAVEDAGFEMRDSIAWLYGSGFPKSLDVSKAIDKSAGAERVSLGVVKGAASSRTESLGVFAPEYEATAPATPDAERWQGWGTALKPAFEPVVVARKPLSGTVAQTVLTHGTGAINVDACRIEGEADRPMPQAPQGGILRLHGFHTLADLEAAAAVGGKCPDGRDARATLERTLADRARYFADQSTRTTSAGRWPANVVLDQSQADALDQQSGETQSKRSAGRNGTDQAGATWGLNRAEDDERGHDDVGGASRFMYVAKADASERVRVNGTAHPTVKPLALMRWLVRLVTPPGGTVLEPFAGSGTTVEACILEGFSCIAIEREAEYLPLIQQRIDRRHNPVQAVRTQGDDMGLFELLEED